LTSDRVDNCNLVCIQVVHTRTNHNNYDRYTVIDNISTLHYHSSCPYIGRPTCTYRQSNRLSGTSPTDSRAFVAQLRVIMNWLFAKYILITDLSDSTPSTCFPSEIRYRTDSTRPACMFATVYRNSVDRTSRNTCPRPWACYKTWSGCTLQLCLFIYNYRQNSLFCYTVLFADLLFSSQLTSQNICVRRRDEVHKDKCDTQLFVH
jgi:hypothetical protein